MRSVSIACFVGLCFSFAAIACDGDDADPIAAPAAESATEAPPTGSANVPSTAPSTATPEEQPPTLQPADGDDTPDADAGAPLADAGDGGKIIIKIPAPKLGKIYVEAVTADMCKFSVDGKLKTTAKVYETTLGIGTHSVSCERNDGSVSTLMSEVLEGQTTDVILPFKKEGTLTVTSSAECTFSIDGNTLKGGPSLGFNLAVAEGAHSVTCAPVAIKLMTTKPVDILSGEPAALSFGKM